MKKLFDFVKLNKGFAIFILLIIVAVIAAICTGAFAMAITVAEPGDPAAGANASTNDMAAPGVDANGNPNTAGQDLAGTVASATQLHGGGLAEDEYDEIIAKFRPYQFPLDTDIRKQASQKKVKGYEVKHIQSGATVLDCETTEVIPSADSITLTSSNVSGKLSMFPAFATILVHGVAGYRDNSATIKQGELMLFVVKNDGDRAICEPLNGKAKVDGEPDMTCPSIPSGSVLSVCANACSESQMIVSPDNFQPRSKTVYLQKKILNVVFTDKFAEQIKKFPFFEEDVKGEALYTFRRRCARSAWVGKQRRFLVNDEKMGEEYAYTQEGILRQVTMLMGVPEEFDMKMLTAMSMFMFTENASGNVARAYCGRNFIKRLLHLKEVKTYKELGFENYTEMGIEVHAYKDNFGKIEFVYDPTLDDLGYEDFACVVDIKNARRYVETESREYTIDMKQGAGENREAKRNVTIIADAVALKGYNSLLVGPSSMLETQNIANAATNIRMVEALPDNPSDGELVFLNSEDGSHEADKAYRYDSATQSWVKYTGAISVS